jgi:phosphomannomutase
MIDESLIAFDLDGTLAESKLPIDSEMSILLSALLEKKKVAVVSGAAYHQFEKQFLSHLDAPVDLLSNLYILPTNGAKLYAYQNAWQEVYTNTLSEDEKHAIFAAFEKARKEFIETGFLVPERIYGVQIEDRGSQITFSAFGSEAPIEVKGPWDVGGAKRTVLRDILIKYLPGFSISIGGTSSLDITHGGVNKAYGLSHLLTYLALEKKDLAYVGDALFPGGNDASVLTMGAHCIEVANVGDTKRLIESWLSH